MAPRRIRLIQLLLAAVVVASLVAFASVAVHFASARRTVAATRVVTVTKPPAKITLHQPGGRRTRHPDHNSLRARHAGHIGHQGPSLPAAAPDTLVASVSDSSGEISTGAARQSGHHGSQAAGPDGISAQQAGPSPDPTPTWDGEARPSPAPSTTTGSSEDEHHDNNGHHNHGHPDK